MAHYILAIDLGTSGPKVALFDYKARCIGSEFEENNVQLFTGGGAEQDPQEWIDSIAKASKRLMKKSKVKKDDVKAIVPTTQWSGTVPVDKHGMHIRHAINWMDTRGHAMIKKYFSHGLTVAGYNAWKLLNFIRINGGVPGWGGKDPAAHMLYIKHNEPEIYEKTFYFLEPKDYITARLTGNIAASRDSMWLYYNTDTRDVNSIEYNEKLIRWMGIDKEKLPPLINSTDIVGELLPDMAKQLGLASGIPVISGTPDTHSALIGSGAVGMYQGHLYVGTSSWINCHVPKKKTDVFHSIASIPAGIPGRYMVINEQESAGACLKYIKNNIIYHEDQLIKEEEKADVFKIFDDIAEGVPAGSNKLIFTPWLWGERTPVEDHTVRSMIFNQTLETTRSHMIRAVFEGVAYNSRWLMEYVDKFTGKPFQSLRFIGGGAQSDVWTQIFSDVMNIAIEQVEDPITANARGAALLGLLAMGKLTIDDIPETVTVKRVFEPKGENRGIYDELYGEYKNLYKVNRDVFKRLNG